MERISNVGVSAARFIGVAAGDEKLTATSRAFRSGSLPHLRDWQKSEQNEMNQWQQEPLGKGTEVLQRYTTGQGDVLLRD